MHFAQPASRVHVAEIVGDLVDFELERNGGGAAQEEAENKQPGEPPDTPAQDGFTIHGKRLLIWVKIIKQSCTGE